MSEAGQNSTGMRDLVIFHAGRIRRAEKDSAEARAAHAGLVAAAANHGVDTDALKDAIKLSKLSPEKLKAALHRRRRVLEFAAYLGVDEVQQMDLEDLIAQQKAEMKSPAADRARAAGRRAGLLGEPYDNPNSKGTPIWQAWEDGFNGGKEEASRISQLPTDDDDDEKSELIRQGAELDDGDGFDEDEDEPEADE